MDMGIKFGRLNPKIFHLNVHKEKISTPSSVRENSEYHLLFGKVTNPFICHVNIKKEIYLHQEENFALMKLSGKVSLSRGHDDDDHQKLK